eukprot:TRINITY_DN2705_c0_g1_i4.p1 TRINITY_DN2705_c0_g1~~TRINITY_DN2705_c0_g1_i4.p1  ORF type:complete len:678 (+),score=142.44 TRINITY_DN2705_c0_g1_i4:102-2135(+)
MSLRIRSFPSDLRRNVEDMKSILFEKKEDSVFMITDPRLLRTIFDEIKSEGDSQTDSQKGSLNSSLNSSNSSYTESTENTIITTNRPRSNSNKEREEGAQKEEKKPFTKGHRRSTSESGSPQGSPLIKTYSSPDRTNLYGSGPSAKLHRTDHRRNLAAEVPSAQTLARSKAMKNYFEEYYWELLAYLQGRSKREKNLKKTLQSDGKNKFQQESLVREHLKKETTILRSRRLCGRLNDFTLLKRIGKGAYGEVFLVQKKNTKEFLALKKLSKANLHVKNQIAHVTAEKDVLKEADSSWLVRLYYTFQDSEYIYFAMDFIPGGDLRAYMENMGDLPESQSRMYMAEMLQAVDSLHLLGYIHRDLKPDNFLIDKNGHLKLADFGLSKKGVLESYKEPFNGQLPAVKLFAPSVLTKKGSWKGKRESVHRAKAYSLVGSPDYMAVEILRGGGYEWEADWWSLGCILYEMLVGFPPFNGETPHEVFRNVLDYKNLLENPQTEDDSFIINDAAWDLITKLICEPEVRLGRESVQEIRNQPFFQDFDWEHVREMKPDFIPQLSSETDTKYFSSATEITPVVEDGTQPTFLQKIQTLPNLTFDDLTFSKAIFERDRQFTASSSDDDSPRSRKDSPRASIEGVVGGRKSPRLPTPRRTVSSRSLKKVSSFDKLGSCLLYTSPSPRDA